MHKIITVTKQISLAAVALTFALLANFAYGSWADPMSAPPLDNVEAPINTGTAQQYKEGNLRADEFHSDRYCDSAGNDCVPHNVIGGTPTVQMGTANHTGYRRTDTVWVPFDVPFSSVPDVHVSITGANFRGNCRNDTFNFRLTPSGITQYGFFLQMTGSSPCGGGYDVYRAGWIAVQ